MRGLREKLSDARQKLLRRNSRESTSGSWGRTSRQSLSRDGQEVGAKGSNSKLSDLRNDTTSEGEPDTPRCCPKEVHGNSSGVSGGNSTIEAEDTTSTRSSEEDAGSNDKNINNNIDNNNSNISINNNHNYHRLHHSHYLRREEEGAAHGIHWAQIGEGQLEAVQRSAKEQTFPTTPATPTSTTTNTKINKTTTITPTTTTTAEQQQQQQQQQPPATIAPGENEHVQAHDHTIQSRQQRQQQQSLPLTPNANISHSSATATAIPEPSTKIPALAPTRPDEILSVAVPPVVGIRPTHDNDEDSAPPSAVALVASSTGPPTPVTPATISATRTTTPFPFLCDDYSIDQTGLNKSKLTNENRPLGASVNPTIATPSSLSNHQHPPTSQQPETRLLIPERVVPLEKPEKGTAASHPPPLTLTTDLTRAGSVTSVHTIAARRASLKEQVLSLRRQSLLPQSDASLINSLLQLDGSPTLAHILAGSIPLLKVSGNPSPSSNTSNTSDMSTRKIWVKRPGGSPTQIVIVDDDLVDAVRDMCLRKYSNALGRQYDAPDLMIKICPPVKSLQRGSRHPSVSYGLPERILGPDEIVSKLLDEYYPGGQSAEDALIVEIPPPPQPQRRTPRPSPGPGHGLAYAQYGTAVPNVHELHLGDAFGEYFPPMANLPPHSAHSQASSAAGHGRIPNAMSIVATSPPIPGSPGRPGHNRDSRVRRMQTQSPTAAVPNVASTISNGGMGVMLMPKGQRNARGASAENSAVNTPVVPPARTASPAQAEASRKADSPAPPVRVASPRPNATTTPTTKKAAKKEKAPSPSGLLDGAVPPINVLIVEDNIINLKLLEAFMKRLKVRWQTAMNGREAVNKWRVGGFHLVLMDIQLPVMNGLEATKEIRRLERVNSIGSFSTSSNSSSEDAEPLSDEDKLSTDSLFKSPVIIVALTASSLQSDRHEALAAGCNDFLTKPVNFIFLERKVTEWGCMQALIDFDGWKSWVGVR